MEKVHKIECLNSGDFAQRFRVIWKRMNSEIKFYGPWSEEYSYPKSVAFHLTDIGVLLGDEVWIQINPVFGSAQETEHHVICDPNSKAIARYNLSGDMRHYEVNAQVYEETAVATKWSARSALTEKDRQVFDIAMEESADVKYTPVYVSYIVDKQRVRYLFYCHSVDELQNPKDFYTTILVIQLMHENICVGEIKQIPVL